MTARRVSDSNLEPTNRRVGSTPEARENQLISLAVDLAERQLREGNASAQVISHYLKASSSREYLEQQRLRMEIELQQAKIEQMASMVRIEDLYEKAIGAMRNYQGDFVAEPEDRHDD